MIIQSDLAVDHDINPDRTDERLAALGAADLLAIRAA